MKIIELPQEIIFNILSFQSFETSDGIRALCSLQSITREFYNKKEFNEVLWKDIFENKFFNEKRYLFTNSNLEEINSLKEIIKENYKYYFSIINHYIFTKKRQKVNKKQNLKSKKRPSSVDYKIVVTGDGGNGKSAITIRFYQNVFVGLYDPTIEDCYRKEIVVDNEKCMVDVLDTAGPEEFSAMRDHYMRFGNSFVLVCSVNNKNSLESLENYFEQIARIKETNIYPCVLCVNKIDLPENEHKITKEIVDEFLVSIIKKGYLSFKCPVLFTSAKDCINIFETFDAIVRLCRIDFTIDMFDLMKRVISDGKKVFEDFDKQIIQKQNKKCYLQ
ncbi:hypothetical protein ABK040_002945 [Willaertia magna]